MRSTVKVGCVVLGAFGLFMASDQAATAAHEKTNPGSNPAAMSRAPSREATDHQRAALPSDAAESRQFASASGLAGKTRSAIQAAGAVNHVDRQAMDARRAPSAEGRAAHTSMVSASGAQAAVVEHQLRLKPPAASAGGRENAAQDHLKTNLSQNRAGQARETGPTSTQKSKFGVSLGSAEKVNHLDRQAVERRRRMPDAEPSVHGRSEKTQPPSSCTSWIPTCRRPAASAECLG